MNRKRNLFIGSSLLALIVACGVGQSAVDEAASEDAPMMATGDGPQAPMFEVDPLWPKNLPDHWLMGPTIGVDVDSTDTIWIVHRNTPDQFVLNTEIGMTADPPVAECCQPGFPVLAFDQEGNLVQSWGGPGTETGDYTWPQSNHGIQIDHNDNVWIGGNGGGDAHVLKFAKDGTFLMQVGTSGARQTGENDGRPVYTRNSHATDSFGRIAEIGIDPDANEVYLADGYFNRRVAVIDADSGEMKRYWGAYGNDPDDDLDLGRYTPGMEPSAQFRGPVHCSVVSNDKLVYVCDPRRGSHPDLPDRRNVRQRAHSRRAHAVTGRSLGYRLLARPRTALHLSGRRAEHEGLHHRARDDGSSDCVWRRWTSAGDVLRGAQHRDRQRRQHLHHRDLRGLADPEVRLQGPRPNPGRCRG